MNNGVGPMLLLGVLATVRENALAEVIQFQYNPESITRTITPRISWGDNGTDNAHSRQAKLIDAPAQTISFKAYFDASDALAAGTGDTIGVGPQLAVLEKLTYPTRDEYQAYEAEQPNGMQIAVMEPPRTILVWGARVFPVRLKSLTITEDAFNGNLIPIRATADITVEVVTYGMRTSDDPDYTTFGAYHVGLEAVASTATGGLSASPPNLPANF